MKLRYIRSEFRFRCFQAAVRFNHFMWRLFMWSEWLQARAHDAWLFGE
jgi:hypothetical protein